MVVNGGIVYNIHNEQTNELLVFINLLHCILLSEIVSQTCNVIVLFD